METLTVQEWILYKLIYDDRGVVQFREYCLPEHPWKKILWRLHNSPMAEQADFCESWKKFELDSISWNFPNTNLILSGIVY